MRDCKRILDGIELVTRELTKHQCPVARKNVETLAQHGIEILGRVVAGIASHDAANPSNSRATTSSKPMEKAKPYDTAWVDEVVSTKPIIDPTIADDAVRKPYDDAWIDEVVNDPQMKFEQFTPSETHEWTERAVPSSPMARIFGFGSLAAKVMLGTAAEAARNIGNPTRSSIASDANTEKLVETLCTMRGAALKLGQMLSIQDEAVVPPALAVALERVRQGAHIMPKKQLYKQMQQELGLDWREKVGEFDDTPIAAASIGQVHRGSLLDGQLVAMKVQYPGVAESIESDLLNLKRLITYTNFLPKGLYMDSILKSAQTELVLECDYLNEQENQMKFRHLVAQDSYMNARFVVPRVHPEMSTSRILTSDLMAGVAIDKILHLPQKIRNRIALRILVLTIKELFAWRFMQTDPNWSNFLYNAATDQIALIDFGAARSYDKEFVDDYFRIVWAAANNDPDTLMEYSLKMGFLTGDESKEMMDAHLAAGMVVGEPFRSHEPFDFEASELTKRLAKHSQVFMQGRLTPPPSEVYSLHRKLAGAFLMCIKLRAVIPCRHVLEEVSGEFIN